jgi:CHAP domain-containing protein
MALQRTLILTSPITTGEDVKEAQRLLKRHGDYQDKIDGEFGILSAQASYRAQFRLGYARPGQGFGPALEKLLTGQAQQTAAMKTLAAKRKREEAKRNGLRVKALAEMKRLIGITEHPPGSNKTIVGDFYGYNDQWCAMAVTMAYVKAGSTGFARGSRWAYVPYIVAAARAGDHGLTVTTDPKPGDLVCFDLDHTNFTGNTNHIGMFEKATGPNKFQTIEGNVSNTCKRMSHSRNSTTKMIFVHASK